MSDNEDRISCLPDDILCHILSFMPTKYSVRTTALSPRWKYVFTLVPVLDFNTDTSKYFVDKVFILYDTPKMTKLRVASNMELDEADFSPWIQSAMRRNVRELDIFLNDKGRSKKLPGELFSCKMLSVLKLEGRFLLKLPNTSLLPSLKTLQLQYVTFDHSARIIFSICPALEDLLLVKCDYGGMLDISHPILRSLYIKDLIYDNELVLNTPSLVSFWYRGSEFTRLSEDTVLKPLDKAMVITDGVDVMGSVRKYIFIDVDVIAKLTTVGSLARNLYLSRNAIEAFQGRTQTLPTFYKLTILKVGKVSKLVLGLLPDLLNLCSLLEFLVFAEGFSSMESNDNDLISYENVPSCVSVHVKKIEFRKFRMQEIECKLVEYFLKNAQGLEKMNIKFDRDMEKNYSELSKKLLKFSRISPDCQIKL